MAGPSEILREYLEDAIAAESTFESRLREFSSEGDDDEVKLAFARHAEETRLQIESLSARLIQLGGEPSRIKAAGASFLSMAPRLAQIGHLPEERTAQNLIAAYTVEAGECAMYEALAVVARRAQDSITENLARQIQAQEQQTAELLWHFLPSRSKIAFNMLTVDEVDPSVETRTVTDRLE